MLSPKANKAIIATKSLMLYLVCMCASWVTTKQLIAYMDYRDACFAFDSMMLGPALRACGYPALTVLLLLFESKPNIQHAVSKSAH